MATPLSDGRSCRPLGWRAHLALLSLALLASLFCCCLSPIYHLSGYGSCDPTCFYMVGKAWMNGLLPYVDVVDVKGPLLFLLYGMGYLLSPGSLIGVFPFYVAACYAVMAAMAKTAGVFGLSPFQSLASAAMGLAVVYWPCYSLHGAQSEQFSLVALSWALYGFVRLLYGEEDRHALYAFAWTLGVGGACCFLIKFNAVAPLATLGALGLCLLVRRRQGGVAGYVVRVAMGAALVLLPFALYLAATSSLGAFGRTYFSFNGEMLSTMYAVAGYGSHLRFLLCGVAMFLADSSMVPVACSVLAMLLPPFGKGRGMGKGETRLFLMVAAASFLVCGVTGILPYYYILCSALSIFPAIIVARSLPAFPRRAVAGLMLLCLVALAVRQNGSFLLRRTVFYPGRDNAIEQRVGAIPSPRLLYLGVLDLGIGLPCGALPAAPKWCTLNGAPERFLQKQWEAVQQRKADFIIAREGYVADEAFLRDCGYVLVEKAVAYRPDIIISLWQRN